MPYTCTLEGSKWALKKADGSKTFGTHSTKRECTKQLRALYANDIHNNANIRLEGYLYDIPDLDYRLSEMKDTIDVVINGPGGSTTAALSIHNKLRNSGKHVRVYVTATAHSAHSIVMLAGDEIYAAENATIMFHPPWIEFPPDSGHDAESLQKLVDRLNTTTKALVTTLMARTKKTEAECRDILCKETWLTAGEALALGVIDEVIPILRSVEVKSYYPERIVNFLKGKNKMPLKDICSQYGLTVTDDNAEESLVKYIDGLKGAVPKKPTEVSDSLLNLVKRGRETEVDALVSDGRITAAVATKLKVRFVTVERIKEDIASGRTQDFEFDHVVDALKVNDKVVNFGGNSGMQIVPKDGKVADDEYLAKLAEKQFLVMK